jgi:hypothetical protein
MPPTMATTSTTRHTDPVASHRIRKRMEEAFGRRSPVLASPEPGIVVWPVSARGSPSPWPPTIWPACQGSWQCSH